jgi:hypothetical protein
LGIGFVFWGFGFPEFFWGIDLVILGFGFPELFWI